MDISNADRVVFPEDGITKGEVCAYYALVTDRLLPFIEGRALTVERFPKGIGEEGFMQKNAPSHFGDDLIDRVTVPKEEGGTTSYPVIRKPEAVIAYANLGVITFHVPPVTVDSGWHPDWVVWDLDPPEGGSGRVREAAKAVRSVLESFDIETLLMTSGSKGYHLRSRIEPNVGLDEAGTVARGASELAVAAHPDLLTVAFRKADRGDRVFVDWLRNTALSTSVAPWSLRPRRGAPVAVPLAWDELDDVAPDGIGMKEIGERLDLDPWNSRVQDLSDTVDMVETALDDAGIVLEPFDRFRS